MHGTRWESEREMPIKEKRYTYTVFKRGDDMPIAVDASAAACAEKMGVAVATFFSIISRIKTGYTKKWRIFKSVDFEEIEKEVNRPPVYEKCNHLNHIDFEIIKGFCNGKTYKAMADKLYMSVSSVQYHIKKIIRLTGLDPKNKADLKKLVEIYGNER